MPRPRAVRIVRFGLYLLHELRWPLGIGAGLALAAGALVFSSKRKLEEGWIMEASTWEDTHRG